MTISGVGAGYVYQRGTRHRTKTAVSNDFFGEISAAAQQAKESENSSISHGKKAQYAPQSAEEKQYQTSQEFVENIDRFNSGIKESLSTEEMMQKIREKMAEIFEKVKKGETEQSFQIGASSFTLKEWEKFIEKFDKSEEEIKKLIKEAREMQKKAAAAKEAANKEGN